MIERLHYFDMRNISILRSPVLRRELSSNTQNSSARWLFISRKSFIKPFIIVQRFLIAKRHPNGRGSSTGSIGVISVYRPVKNVRSYESHQSQLLGPFRQSSDKDLEHNSMNTQNGCGISVQPTLNN
jgi:hypothetical protein